MIEIEDLKTEISKMEMYFKDKYFEDSEYHMVYSPALQELKNIISDYEIEEE